MIRLGALGDVLRTLPAVTALRSLHPGSHLCWLVEPSAASAVAATGCVDETLVFPRGAIVAALRRGDLRSLVRDVRAFVQRLRSRRFELVLDFHGIAKSGLLAALSGASWRYGHRRGIAREASWLFSNRRVDLVTDRVSRYERNAALVHGLSPALAVPTGPLLRPPQEALAQIALRLRELGREHARGFVLIHPGSSGKASHKRYAPAAWSAVANELIAEGREVWITGGTSSDERALVAEIRAGCGERVVEAPETVRFEDLLALIARAGVFAASDSGPLHAASLVGVPVVQLLGPTDPVHNEPAAASPWRRVHVPLPCSPCRRGCADAACMRAIAPGRVVRAIRELLACGDGSGGPPGGRRGEAT